MTRWLDIFDGPVWRYRSDYRPITQLPLSSLDVVFDPDNLGPDVRDLITARALTLGELNKFELTPVAPDAEMCRNYQRHVALGCDCGMQAPAREGDA